MGQFNFPCLRDPRARGFCGPPPAYLLPGILLPQGTRLALQIRAGKNQLIFGSTIGERDKTLTPPLNLQRVHTHPPSGPPIARELPIRRPVERGRWL